MPVGGERSSGFVRLCSAWPSIFVGATWLGMVFVACNYVATYASRIPLQDDLEAYPATFPGGKLEFSYLWSLRNEHRTPLPSLFQVWLLRLTDDVRSGMFASILALALAALALIFAARRLRGRTSWTDALFPLLLLHTGNCENLLMGFQMCLMLPTAFVAVMLIVLTRRARGIVWQEALVCGVLVFALPLCGGPGLTQMPAIAAWLAVLAWFAWRARDPKSKWTALILTTAVVMTIALAVLYMVGFQYPANSPRTSDPVRILQLAMRVWTYSFGPAGDEYSPYSDVLFASVALATLALLAWTWKRRPEERMRVGALTFCLGASALVGLGIGHGRGGFDALLHMCPNRYCMLPAPSLCTITFAWILYGTGLTRSLIPGVLCVALAFADVTANRRAGLEFGAARLSESVELERQVRMGVSTRELLDAWTGLVYPDRERLWYLIQNMAIVSTPPFDVLDAEGRKRYQFRIFESVPTKTVSTEPPQVRRIEGGAEVLLVPVESTLHFKAGDGARKLHVGYGMLPESYESENTPGVRIVILALDRAHLARKVFVDRILDPVHVANDRGTQVLDADLGAEDPREILLRVLPAGDRKREPQWAYWSAVSIQ